MDALVNWEKKNKLYTVYQLTLAKKTTAGSSQLWFELIKLKKPQSHRNVKTILFWPEAILAFKTLTASSAVNV